MGKKISTIIKVKFEIYQKKSIQNSNKSLSHKLDFESLNQEKIINYHLRAHHNRLWYKNLTRCRHFNWFWLENVILHSESASIIELWSWLSDCHTTAWWWGEAEINGARGNKRYKKSAPCLGHHNSGDKSSSLFFVQLLVEKDKMKKLSPFKYYVKFNIVVLSKKISQISRYKKSVKFLY